MSSTSRGPVSNCKRCGSPISAGWLECPQCHAFVHADELTQISYEAKLLESSGDLRAARERWLTAVPLLPADAQQTEWINRHAVDLYAQALEAEVQQQQQNESKSKWAKRLGPFAPLLILLGKAKVLFGLLKLKFILSFAGFIWFYWTLFGMWFGVGFAVLILCHEMGHYVEVKRRGLPVEVPVFLPGLGAYVKWKNLGVSGEGRAMISLAGPLAGFLSSAVCILGYSQTHSKLWLALAHSGAWLNLMNLIPVWALDGAQAIQAVSRQGKIMLLLACLLLFWGTHEYVLLFIGAGALWQVFLKPPEEETSPRIAAYFALLLCGLAAILVLAPGQGFGVR